MRFSSRDQSANRCSPAARARSRSKARPESSAAARRRRGTSRRGRPSAAPRQPAAAPCRPAHRARPRQRLRQRAPAGGVDAPARAIRAPAGPGRRWRPAAPPAASTPCSSSQRDACAGSGSASGSAWQRLRIVGSSASRRRARQDEARRAGRLLERLQQRIGGDRIHPLGRMDDHHLGAAACAGALRKADRGAHRVDLDLLARLGLARLVGVARRRRQPSRARCAARPASAPADRDARAMACSRQAAHTPQAPCPRARAASSSHSHACASAIASSNWPTPAGPAISSACARWCCSACRQRLLAATAAAPPARERQPHQPR